MEPMFAEREMTAQEFDLYLRIERNAEVFDMIRFVVLRTRADPTSDSSPGEVQRRAELESALYHGNCSTLYRLCDLASDQALAFTARAIEALAPPSRGQNEESSDAPALLTNDDFPELIEMPEQRLR